jgi:hypothetical protein
MNEERKPLWPWIIVALFGLPALYVASFGPACWLTTKDYSRRNEDLLRTAYWPLVRGLSICPRPIQPAVHRTIDRWLPPFWEFTAEKDTDLFWFFFDERAEAGEYKLIPMPLSSNATSNGT